MAGQGGETAYSSAFLILAFFRVMRLGKTMPSTFQTPLSLLTMICLGFCLVCCLVRARWRLVFERGVALS